MIEKPKRPKKPDIQERQPPRTLQELRLRYDLDNTKIYDFLDELVKQINSEKESIDTNINRKVNKSGDTLTGELLFENKNVYNAIRKTRTFNNEDYQVSVGVGGNMCARMEYIKVPDNVLSSVEARSNGIYNGVSGNKLIESKNQVAYGSWHSVVLTRSDNNYLYVMLYGSNHLKEGNYSIANNFKLVTYGSTYSELTIPKSALSSISRRDWGFELIFNRSGISGIASGQYNGVAVPYDGTLLLQST